MTNPLEAIKRAFANTGSRDELVAFLGLALVSIGIWIYSPSLALVVVGGLIFIVGLLGVISGHTVKNRRSSN